MLANTEKITARHRERHAYVYVRQSSPKQVQHHQESQRTQYALVERAAALGWPAERVHVIDADLGQSGQDDQRRGFQELVAEVSLGQVGLIVAFEASRLARSNAAWYTLLDLATMVGTLIADTEGIYDPRSYNDRLLLGLRGMLSEAELHVLQLRMAAGRQRQIERGAFRQRLPTGLVRLPDGRVVKDPDIQVQHAIALVFALFAELGSCQKVLRRLRDEGVRLPRRQTGGPDAGDLLWKAPSEGVLYSILHNPAYAGAFAYGRRGVRPDRLPGQRARERRRAMAEWTALHQNTYPGYISWEDYVANQERLSDNAARYVQHTRGAARDGAALLTGLAACGRCGRQMHVEYKGQHRYVCSALAKEYGATLCMHLDGPSLDAAVVSTFFEALQPAELNLLEEVLATLQTDQTRLAQQYADQVTRAEYEAHLAERQYRAVDPDNRLVAAELERRWEVALRAVVEAREAVDRFAHTQRVPTLDPALRAQLTDLSTRLPELWDSGRLSAAHKKDLLRSLIRRVILTRPQPDAVAVQVIWLSGASTSLTVRPPVAHSADLSDYAALLARVRALVQEGHQDAAIAQQLTAEGFRSARALHVPTSLVTRLRRHLQVTSATTRFRSQEKVDGRWTIGGLSRALDLDRNWLYVRIRAGLIPAERHPVIGYYLIPDDPHLLAQLVAQRPPQRQRETMVGES
jgi:DNA invertase Pin-like site-specific DNA recombinase